MPSMLKRWTRTFYAWKRRRTERWFRPGAKVRGRYTIIKQIGEGSFGQAYLCRDRFQEGHFCVLKRVQPLRGRTQPAMEVYQLETAILNRMRHKSIPALYERFVYRNSFCFTMEYAPGVSLEKMLYEDNKRFSEIDALMLIGNLLDILAYVHAEGVVHLDIGVANVIVGGADLHLIDFGKARLLPVRTDEQEDGGPMDHARRIRISVVSDFFALGRLLILLLYQSRNETSGEEIRPLHPHTKRLLRRLLQEEPPYPNALEAKADVHLAIQSLQLEATS